MDLTLGGLLRHIYTDFSMSLYKKGSELNAIHRTCDRRKYRRLKRQGKGVCYVKYVTMNSRIGTPIQWKLW